MNESELAPDACRCPACHAPTPYHLVGCGEALKMATEDRTLRQREVEAQERLALAAQMQACVAFTSSTQPLSQRADTEAALSSARNQINACVRLLNDLTPQTSAPAKRP